MKVTFIVGITYKTMVLICFKAYQIVVMDGLELVDGRLVIIVFCVLLLQDSKIYLPLVMVGNRVSVKKCLFVV